jgi:hypothetical protein
MKILAVIVFIAILGSLGSALYHLVKHPEGDESGKTAKMLTIRIGLSLVLFILLFIAYASGLFQPQGLGARIEQLRSEKAAEPHP